MRDQLQAIYRQHRQALYTVALSITRQADRAEDAVHDAFARLCRASAPPADDLTAYAYRAVRNAAIDIARRRSAMTIDDAMHDSIFTGGSDAGPDPLIADETQSIIRQAIDKLPQDQREVVVMKLYGGLTFEQIAAAMDEPLSTVASRYRRTLDRLKEELASLVGS